jgi:hypothetical protein
MRIHKFVKFGKYLTLAYWRTRMAFVKSGRPLLRIQKTVLIETSESELAQLIANAPELDTSDYVLLRPGDE